MYQQVPADSTYLTAIGTATTDVVIAMTKAAKPYARFTVKAEVAKETHWLSVIAFDAAVVDGARQVRQGARVDVGGRLQVRTWTGTDGKEDPYDGLPF
ncbi:MAG TPA: single-stranded DNA-binding protein [Chloroflexota bacterium]|nr:single-stranded DNA-binding protein [Chloroflexota bacterium]